jgi:hypothetical protein
MKFKLTNENAARKILQADSDKNLKGLIQFTLTNGKIVLQKKTTLTNVVSRLLIDCGYKQ